MQTQCSGAYAKMSLCTQNAQPYFSVQYYPVMGNTWFNDIRTRKEMEIAGIHKNGHKKIKFLGIWMVLLLEFFQCSSQKQMNTGNSTHHWKWDCFAGGNGCYICRSPIPGLFTPQNINTDRAVPGSPLAQACSFSTRGKWTSRMCASSSTDVLENQKPCSQD